MCRADVTPAASSVLAALLTGIAARLAADHGVNPALVRIGPVDFGDDPSSPHRQPSVQR